jgi:hypothetical protein
MSRLDENPLEAGMPEAAGMEELQQRREPRAHFVRVTL